MTSTLNEYLVELEHISNNEGPEAMLRYSGEGLAAFAKKLFETPVAQSSLPAREMLVVARTHVNCLLMAGMPLEALTTLIMALATVIAERVNPEALPSTYLTSLQEAALLSVNILNQTCGEDYDLLQPVAVQLTVLAHATADSYIGRLIKDDAQLKYTDSIKELIAGYPQLFNRSVAPQQAIDILTDCAARLKAFGTETNDIFDNQ